MSEDKMSLFAHLADLRKRLVICMIALGIAFGVSFEFSEDIFKLLMFPLRYSLDIDITTFSFAFVPADKLQSTKLVFLAPAEAFWMHIKVSFVSAIFLALPVIFHQLWLFIAPGLHEKEKKYVVPFVLAGTLLFAGGSAFCFLIVLPFALGFLLTYKVGDFLMPMLSVGQYADFCLKFVLAFGAIFELPIILIFLTKVGVITTDTLKKQRKLAVVLAFVAGGILTPTPDAFNQTLMAVPIVLLYELGIWLSVLLTRKKKEQDGQEL